MGWIKESSLTNLYSINDVFLVPSYYDGVPLVALEALACGTPIVATPVGITPALFKMENIGKLAQPNTESFAEGIFNMLAEDKEKYEQSCRKIALRFD